jgi:hypothetical protein
VPLGATAVFVGRWCVLAGHAVCERWLRRGHANPADSLYAVARARDSRRSSGVALFVGGVTLASLARRG